ncbi:MAG: hypothetical protein AAB424_02445 [Patescibacteria group bacterium]
MNILPFVLFIIGIAAGYGIAKFFAGKNENVQGRLPSIIFRVRGHKVHIHHWMWSIALLLLLIVLRIQSYLIYGFLIGITLQGLNYRNRFRIVYKA